MRHVSLHMFHFHMFHCIHWFSLFHKRNGKQLSTSHLELACCKQLTKSGRIMKVLDRFYLTCEIVHIQLDTRHLFCCFLLYVLVIFD